MHSPQGRRLLLPRRGLTRDSATGDKSAARSSFGASGRVRTNVPNGEGTHPPIDTPHVWLTLPTMPDGEFNLHGILPPDGSGTWHLVETPLAPRSICGQLLLYGSRLGAWGEIPRDERCAVCLRLVD